MGQRIVGLAQRVGHQRWFSLTGRLLLAPLDRVVGRLTKGRVIALGLLPGLLMLTTTGRRSGRPRTTALFYLRDGDDFVVIGSNWGQHQHPAWSLNLLADPAATVAVQGQQMPVRAALVTGPRRDELLQKLRQAWPPYREYARRAGGRELRIFVLSPS
jgi:deazaflavin-dependent oxidoreductase (nitroreductase family)